MTDRETSQADAIGTEAAPEGRSTAPTSDRYWLREGGDGTKRAAALDELEGKKDELAVQAKMRRMKLAFWGTIALVLAGVIATLIN